MNISLNTDYSCPTTGKATRQSLSEGFDGCIKSIREQEKEKEEDQSVGGWMPGGQSVEEHQRMEMLKGKAMQIASQAKDGLTPGQEAEIKDIEKEIGKIANMPMSEGLSRKAKQVAESVKEEQDLQAREEDIFQSESKEFQLDENSTSQFRTAPGLAMLHRNALVTAVKGMSAGSTALKG